MTPMVHVREDKPHLSPLVIGIAVVFLPPLGLYLLWKHPVLGKHKEWWIGAGVWSLLWLGGVMQKQEPSVRNEPESNMAVKRHDKEATPKKSGSGSRLADMRARVSVGMSKQEVEKLLGPPEEKHDLGESQFELPDEQWTYLNDSLGINFRKGRVWLIQP